MALHLVIDGYNLIGAGRGQDLGDIEAQRESLIDTLGVYRRLRRINITVVFDGTYSGRLTGSSVNRGGVRVIFSRNGQEADEVIKGLVRDAGGGLTVATSDRSVASYAEGNGAVVLSSAEFRNLLDDALYEDLKGAAPEEDDDAEGFGIKKGPSKKPPKNERRKRNRIKKL